MLSLSSLTPLLTGFDCEIGLTGFDCEIGLTGFDCFVVVLQWVFVVVLRWISWLCSDGFLWLCFGEFRGCEIGFVGWWGDDVVVCGGATAVVDLWWS